MNHGKNNPMAQITSGKVSYARTVQPVQFESKKAEVELSFILAEGEDLDNTLEDVGNKVRAECLRLVGLRTRDTA